ncbi:MULTISPECIES: helix-turn-helix domain-containing protein [unclassified Mesorhizobium]|uniref:helix-turn-helix domain-containing protein n=1 Tax=unclassified Mesorhizobium TaxID=325217 RepID=UPI000BAF1F03|nr:MULTISPECIES: helix-turn-helix domain-containing protein [unclassified Mesorhizobium]TGT53315.1 helix-turn-helix domain-containing protein [Mesorhizobium sp. M00.F.Ca.ET.170.01.1.1]AZO11790.1 helix-turn-helix domain-containing protein [Mesorhizobium sp. M3A.F.Ca.ET.080.04.2.1]PBB83617.1 AraC family transcriptional regulator [Mesorhizobium sp. WSM3876]RWB72573.1 MAG: helix-turn-helix domain-containing protein [Mesorhizobium sp.]RWB87156.1 MAG: helix-turn-helix domain-containing protein [Meso
MRNPIIAAIAFDGISAFHLSVPCLVFGADRTQLGLPRFDFRVCAIEKGQIHTDAGLTISVPHDLCACDEADIVIVPSWKDLDVPLAEPLKHALRKAHRRGALIVGLCLGTFAIAAAGLLAGRKATTHWAYADQLQALHPDIAVDADVLYVDDGDIVTSAGVAAGLDCCLHIVRDRYGAAAALRLARHVVLSPHRQGGQAQFIERPLAPTPNADRFTKALDEVRTTLGQAHSLDSVADSAGLTRRTFTRRFQKSIGASFGEWLADQRVGLAQRLLEETDKSIDVVAFEAGFGSATSLRQHFAARLKISPLQYRREFSRNDRDEHPALAGKSRGQKHGLC